MKAAATPISISPRTHKTIADLRKRAQDCLTEPLADFPSDALNQARQLIFEIEAYEAEGAEDSTLEMELQAMGEPPGPPFVPLNAAEFEARATQALEILRPGRTERFAARLIVQSTEILLGAVSASPGDAVSAAKLGPVTGSFARLDMAMHMLRDSPESFAQEVLRAKPELDSLRTAATQAAEGRSFRAPVYFVVEDEVH
ncbi:MAG: hypothetical protein ACKVPX_09435 [Myxococcaceae bacterium]